MKPTRLWPGNHLVERRRVREARDCCRACSGCRASYSIVLVGYDTLIWPPPVKNGFTSCRSGVIMIMCSDSAPTCGTRDQVVRAQVVDRLDEQIHDHPRLAAGRHGAVLGLLDRLLPVVAEAHLARRLQHLAGRTRRTPSRRARSAPRACTESSLPTRSWMSPSRPRAGPGMPVCPACAAGSDRASASRARSAFRRCGG